MKALLIALVIGTASCTALHQHTTPRTPQEAVVEAKKMVDEANLAIIAIARTARSNYQAGVYTQAEAAAIQERLADLATKVDGVRDALDLGLPDALDKAKLINAVILALHKEVAARARKP